MKILKYQVGDYLLVIGVAVKKLSIAQDGGEGSGNFGHSGRPGKIGGSGEGDAKTDDVFGKSYTEYTGKPEKAIEKLMSEKQGFVPAAINKEGIGDIDFVYGEGGIKGYGLAHIAEKHGEDIVNKLPDLIENGSVDNSQAHLGRSFVYSEDKKVVISLTYLNSERIWLLTAYDIDK